MGTILNVCDCVLRVNKQSSLTIMLWSFGDFTEIDTKVVGYIKKSALFSPAGYLKLLA